MDGGVYNRSLFRRKESARDGLSRMGGIMAASPELMAAAEEMMPVQTGQGRVLFQAPSIVGAMPGMAIPQRPQMPMPMPQQPMPMAPAPMPMAPAPMPQPMAPAPMPPQMPMPQQRPQMRFQAGGIVDLGAPMLEVQGAMESMGGQQTFDRPIRPRGAPPAAPTEEQTQSGANAALAQIREQLSDPAADPMTQAEVILEETAGQTGVEPTGDTQSDLVAAAESLGVMNAREMRIDQLNRAITGAAIAAGTSPSAAENIANGMLEGLKLQRAEELRRLAADAAQLQALQGNEQGATWFDTPRGKLALKIVEQRFGTITDPETIVAELNSLDTNSPEGARLGDQFRAALAEGAAPPGIVAPSPEQPAPEGGAQPPDMNYLVGRAQAAISAINASNVSPEEKARRIEGVRATFAQMGGNPSLLSTGQ